MSTVEPTGTSGEWRLLRVREHGKEVQRAA